MGLTALRPAITVVKSASPTTVANAGEQVAYSFLVTNTGNATLTSVNVTDVQADTNAPAVTPVCPVATLAPGEHTTCTATYRATQTDIDNGTFTDTATAHGTGPYPDGGTPPGATDSLPSTATVSATAAPSLTVLKSSTTTLVTSLGQVIPYTFLVTNTGNVTLTSVSVSDIVAAPSTQANLAGVNCPQTTLAPGDTTTCTATYTTTRADATSTNITDTAIASGLAPGTDPTAPQHRYRQHPRRSRCRYRACSGRCWHTPAARFHRSWSAVGASSHSSACCWSCVRDNAATTSSLWRCNPVSTQRIVTSGITVTAPGGNARRWAVHVGIIGAVLLGSLTGCTMSQPSASPSPLSSVKGALPPGVTGVTALPSNVPNDVMTRKQTKID